MSNESPCPFCLGQFFTNPKIEGVPQEIADVSIVHSHPPCKTFMENEVLDYLRLVRRKLVPGSFD